MSVELTRLPGVKPGSIPYYSTAGFTVPTNDPSNNYLPIWLSGRLKWVSLTALFATLSTTPGDLFVIDENGALVALHELASGTFGDILTPQNKGGGIMVPTWTAQSAIDVSSFGGGAALTRTNDTNVTATLTGTPTTALLRATDIALGWTGTLSDARGGIDTGAWTPVSFTAGDFTASAGNWTLTSGDQTTFAYRLFGKTMVIAFVLSTTTVSATPATLSIKIPASKTANRTVVNPVLLLDNGARTTGYATINSGATVININRTDAALFATATDTTYVWGEITFETT